MKQTIYLDHAAGTFLLPGVSKLIHEFADSLTGNPSSIHGQGRLAHKQLDRSRRSIAHNLGAKHGEIVFTSGGTEANNLALKGLANSPGAPGKHIISCATEHPSTLESLVALERDGFEISNLPVDASGQIKGSDLKQAMRPDTALITVMWINNETGLIHPIEELGTIARSAGVPFHCDAVQAAGHETIDLSRLPVAAMSFSGHKMGAPAGTGVLFLRKGTALQVQSHGGSQENNLRGGTPNVLGALSFAKALEIQTDQLLKHQDQLIRLNKRLQDKLSEVPGLRLNRQGRHYAPHILNCSISDVDGEAMFIRLDMLNIAVSNGSACTSGSQTPSHVLSALGFNKELAQATIRVSLSYSTTEKEIDLFCQALAEIVLSIKREPL